MQSELFNKEKGMKLAADANRQWLEKARELAIKIGKNPLNREVGTSIEQVRCFWKHDVPFGNWAGSIFKDGNWEHLGYRQARHEGSHGRIVKTWRLKSQEEIVGKQPNLI